MTVDASRIAAVLPNYDIEGEVGRGAWGIVYSAEHRQLRRHVAIKELPPAFAADPAVRQRFASEARLLASFDHPHIVPIFDYVEQDGMCLLVMDLLPGGTVWDRYNAEKFSPEAACSVVLATCSALEYAHGKGVLHRDIKPENLLFSPSGTLKVTDFGIAKVIGGVGTAMTRTGEVLGTPSYMAPEQATGGDLIPATDVYAVGTLLYELLSGRLPFVDDGNMIAMLYRHVHEPPVPLLDVAPSVPATIADVTMQALATDPADRPASATDLGVAIAEATNAAWAPGWTAQAGIAVMASGQIAARLSGPDHRPVSKEGEARSRSTPTLISSTSADQAPAGGLEPPDPSGPAVVLQPPDLDRGSRRSRRRLVILVAGLIGACAAVGVVVAALLMKAPATSPTAASLGRLVFEDSFSDPRSGWAPDAGQNGAGSAEYFDGGYQVAVLKPLPALNTFSVASPYATKLPALAMTVDSTFLRAAPSDGAGVRCDVDARLAVRYTFEIHANGSWQIFRLGGPGEALVAQGTSPAIRTGNATNAVTGECRQLPNAMTSLVMAVNGEIVGRATNSPGAGVVGWRSALVVYRSAKSPGTVTRFTNFRAYDASGT